MFDCALIDLCCWFAVSVCCCSVCVLLVLLWLCCVHVCVVLVVISACFIDLNCLCSVLLYVVCVASDMICVFVFALLVL